MSRALAVALVVLLAGPAAAQPSPQAGTRAAAAPSLSADALMASIRTLTAPGMDGRLTGSEGGRKARAWVVARFEEAGLEPLGAPRSSAESAGARARGFEAPFETPVKGVADGTPQPAANVVGRCAGRQPNGPAIVVSAHYDHVGVRDGQVYWGADDNASGVAVLVGLAAHCVKVPFQHDVIFVAFDAEEQGLRGAKAFLAAPPIAPERIAFNLNMDMVSRSATREIFIAGTHYRPELRTVVASPAARSSVRVRFGHDVPGTGHDDWTSQSDHGAFHEAGIPFLYFGVEDHPDYHKPTDTVEKIDPAFVEGVAAMILDALTAIDASLPRR